MAAMAEITSVKDLFERHITERLRRKFDLVEKIDAVYQFDISGPGGGTWTVDCTQPGGKVTSGREPSAGCIVTCGDGDLLDIVTGKLSAQMAFMSGRLRIQGDPGLAMKLQQIL
jgi:hypothetical protein